MLCLGLSEGTDGAAFGAQSYKFQCRLRRGKIERDTDAGANNVAFMAPGPFFDLRLLCQPVEQ